MFLGVRGRGGGGGGGVECILAPYQILIFAGEEPNICTSTWYTSGRAEAGLFSRYRSLKVGGVIQHGSVVLIFIYNHALLHCN